MARFIGRVGFAKTEETVPGVWTENIRVRIYSGDVIRNHSRRQPNQGTNEDIIFSNSISILADPMAKRDFPYIKFVVWRGTAWKVESVEEQFPRLILNLGGIYNGPTTNTTE